MSAANPRGLLSFLRLQPELDQPADGFGANGAVGSGPSIRFFDKRFRHPDRDVRISTAGRWPSSALFWCHLY